MNANDLIDRLLEGIQQGYRKLHQLNSEPRSPDQKINEARAKEIIATGEMIEQDEKTLKALIAGEPLTSSQQSIVDAYRKAGHPLG